MTNLSIQHMTILQDFYLDDAVTALSKGDKVEASKCFKMAKELMVEITKKQIHQNKSLNS